MHPRRQAVPSPGTADTLSTYTRAVPQPRAPSPLIIARRRAGHRRLALLVAGILLVIAFVVSIADRGHARKLQDKHKAHTHHVQLNPLTTAAVSRLIASRSGDVSAAVENLVTGHEWLLDADARDQTASIIKVDILETLLYQTEESGQPISDAEGAEPQEMIEASDDDDATALWNQIGGATGIGAYNASAGLTQTSPNTEGYWGETLTSGADQIKILQQLAKPSRLLSPDAQEYALDLMTNIDPGQNWGVTGGVPAGVTVALKNGWVPLTSGTDWEINSIGWVKGDGRDYLIAVLTAHDPSEQYGIRTIDEISADVYSALGTTARGGAAKRRAGKTTTKKSV